jgi:3-hydroxyisobutyrate dehydrogenase-like beta-hydroxyacid dehydrogenase
MKAGFIGLGRMGQEMARRLVAAGHDIAVYNRTADKAKPLADAGAKVVGSIADAARYGDIVYTMLADDAAAEDVVFQQGLLQSLPKGGIHVCCGTHGVAVIGKLNEAHKAAGQILVAQPVLGRPQAVATGVAALVIGGPPPALEKCRPLFEAIGKRIFTAGNEPVAAAAIKIASEGFSLVRKYGVVPQVFYEVMTEGLFAAPAYKTYGQIMVDESYSTVGQMAVLGLKDANLALAAGGAVGVPLPSGNVWRDRLVGAVAHGDGNKDWAVMALEQARASGLA